MLIPTEKQTSQVDERLLQKIETGQPITYFGIDIFNPLVYFWQARNGPVIMGPLKHLVYVFFPRSVRENFAAALKVFCKAFQLCERTIPLDLHIVCLTAKR